VTRRCVTGFFYPGPGVSGAKVRLHADSETVVSEPGTVSGPDLFFTLSGRVYINCFFDRDMIAPFIRLT
jgi:hypothetical protein